MGDGGFGRSEELEERREVLRLRIGELEEALRSETVRETMFSMLNVVGVDMHRFAQRLGLERSDNPIRIDPGRLTVVADTPAGSVPLAAMGSGANWVGYHLVTYLALHKFFIDEGRPVPRFVVFDQPTQAFYPPDVQGDAGLDSLDDADRLAVKKMFEVLGEVAGELAPNLQIIVLDHARLSEPWFEEALVEEWRGGARLIPGDWPSV